MKPSFGLALERTFPTLSVNVLDYGEDSHPVHVVGHVERRHLHHPAVVVGAGGRDGDLQRNHGFVYRRAKVANIRRSILLFGMPEHCTKLLTLSMVKSK